MGLTKFFLVPTTISVAFPLSFAFINSRLQEEIILATYQSYISEEIAEEAFDTYALKTIYFETDKEVFNGFASGAFDLAVLSSSTLEEAVDKGLVKKINWDKFDSVKDKIKNGGTESGKKNWDQIYSPVVQKFFTVAPNLADYGVPYFLSYLAFAYRGSELSFEDTGVEEEEEEEKPKSAGKVVSWNKLIKKVTEESRFHSSGDLPKLGLVEDELTIYSLSKLSQDEEEMTKVDSSPKKSVAEKLFEKEIRNTESEFYNQFMQLNKAGIDKKTLGSRPLFLSPDSVVLSEMLSSGQLEGIFMYNGDALYAQQLLDESEEEEDEADKDDDEDKEEDEEDSEEETVVETASEDRGDSSGSEAEDSEKTEIKVISGFPYLWLLDSIAISAQVTPEKEEQIYKFIDKLSFENLKDIPSKERKILNDDDAPEDAGWLLKNFMAIWYTPTLKDFSGWIKGEQNSKGQTPSPKPEGSDEDEFKREQEFLYGVEDVEKCLEKKPQPSEGSEENSCSIVFERGLSDTQNLNLALAFERWKSNF